MGSGEMGGNRGKGTDDLKYQVRRQQEEEIMFEEASV